MSNLFKGAALFVGGALVGAAAVVLLSAKTDGQVQNDLSDLLAGVKKRVKECYNQVKTDLDESQAEAAAKTQAEANGQSDKQKRRHDMENDFFNQVKNEMTEYGMSLGNVGKWRLIAVVSRVLGLFLLIFTLVLCVFAVFTFCAVAAIDAMSAFMPVWAAALIMGAAYIVLILIALACRRQLFIQPFIKLLSKQITTTEELALKTMEAEHQEELQRVRLQCHVDSAMRQFDLYTGIIAAVWRYIKGLLSK